MIKSPLSFLLATLCLAPLSVVEDGAGAPAPTPEPETPESPEAPAESSSATPPLSAAARFMASITPKKVLAGENASLRTEIATHQAEISRLTTENEALAGAAEAAVDLQERLTAIESTLGIKAGSTPVEIKAALTKKISDGALESAALAGVPARTLPAAASDDIDPEKAKFNALPGLDRARASFGQQIAALGKRSN